MFPILILTKDEEDNLPACLASVSWSDDVVVLASLSTGRSQEIAKDLGARVFERKFDNFGAQRAYALDEIEFKNPWVFHLDADEIFNDELRAECERVIKEDKLSGFFVPNKIIFLGKWIKRSTQYPFPQVRLVKVGEVTFAQAGHGQKEDNAKRGIGHIEVAYDHFNFSKGLADWIAKHNNYSTQEVAYAAELREKDIQWGDLFGEKAKRNLALKTIYAHLPFRWVIKFVYLYIFRLGFLDGRPGFYYCGLQAAYEFMITAKIAEAKHQKTLDV